MNGRRNQVDRLFFLASDIEQLTRFASGGYCDDSTIVYLQHPCVILTALEVLGYKVVASSSTSVKQDYNEYMWTMRKDFSEPEPELVIKARKFHRRDTVSINFYTSMKVNLSKPYETLAEQRVVVSVVSTERHVLYRRIQK